MGTTAEHWKFSKNPFQVDNGTSQSGWRWWFLSLLGNVMICFGCSKCQVGDAFKGQGLILTRSGLEAAQDTVSMVHSSRQFGNTQKPIQRQEIDKGKNKQRPRDGKLMRWGTVERRVVGRKSGGRGGGLEGCGPIFV